MGLHGVRMSKKWQNLEFRLTYYFGKPRSRSLLSTPTGWGRGGGLWKSEKRGGGFWKSEKRGGGGVGSYGLLKCRPLTTILCNVLKSYLTYISSVSFWRSSFNFFSLSLFRKSFRYFVNSFIPKIKSISIIPPPKILPINTLTGSRGFWFDLGFVQTSE